MATTRHVQLLSPLKPEELLLQRAHVVEELGRPFTIELSLLSLDPALPFAKLLGDTMTVVLTLASGERYWNGHVARFGQGGALGRYTRYTCTLRPHLWMLTRASDSRIFKKMTVPQIVEQVVSQFGIGQVESKLQGDYPQREYTVMYRETYFDFVSRLLEEEGISYFFRHEKSRHFCVLCDDSASHKAVPGYETIPFIDPANAVAREEHVAEWVVRHEVASGAFAVNDFDFEVPKADLLAKSSKSLPQKHAALEMYDPVAGFVEALDAGSGGDTNRGDRGELFARVRLEELQSAFDRASGRGSARGLAVGSTFALSGHPRDDQNRELLVVRSEATMFQPGYDAGSAAGEKDEEEEPLFEIEVTTQPAKTPFRPARTTPRPVIAGPHAGMVVGSGEIWTDKHGRVKVHFPWDREDMEGCWIRVAQGWAGGSWGAMQVPRVGQEVIVEFVEGDPDRPIITGRVYNGANGTPFGMPGGATRSGILTRSTPGGSADNANELRFEDKKGEEQLFLHAEKNMDTEVEKDQTTWVGHDRKKTVDNDQLEEIKGNKTIKVHKNHQETILQNMDLSVEANENEKIKGNRGVEVGGNHNETIKGTQGVSVAKDGTWSVGGNGAMTFQGTGAFSVGKKLTQDVGADYMLSVADNATVGVNKNANVTVDQNAGLKVEGAMTVSVTKDCTLTVEGANKNTITKAYGLKAKEILIEAESKIVIKQGGASITLEGGNIVIKAGEIDVKGDSSIAMKGSKVTQN